MAATVNILLVDDQPANLLALEVMLVALGQNLVTAQSGEEALKRLLDDDFAAILLDVQMPRMDGFETAALIRQRDRCRATPIIFLTAHAYSELQIFEGYSLGAVDFLVKPILPDVLRAKVAVFVELAAKTKEIRHQADLLRDTQLREHERHLAEEKQRWQMERLRQVAETEKRNAEVLTQKAAELAKNVAERVRAEENLCERIKQLALMADLGQRALAGTEADVLMNEAANRVAQVLNVEYCVVLEALPDGKTLQLRAGVGWQDGYLGHTTLTHWTDGDASFALQQDEPVIVEDLSSESRFDASPLLRDHGAISGLSVIIRGPLRPFGVLGVHARKKRAFSGDDVHFLQGVANVLATAIQRKKDEEELSALKDQLAVQLNDMTRLYELSGRLSKSLDLQTILNEVLTATTGMLRTDLGELRLYDRDDDSLRTVASLGFGEESQKPVALLRAGQGACGAAVVRQEPVVIENGCSDPLFAPYQEAARVSGFLAVYSVPLLTRGGNVIGTLDTYFRVPYRPSEREGRQVELYARQAAEAIDNARLYQEIQEANQRKDRFLATLAHELRNPLAPLRNALELLRRADGDGRLLEQARAMAQRQVQHLTRLVDDLLDVSRINRGIIQLNKQPVELTTLLAHALESTQALFENRSQELAIDWPSSPIPLAGDATRLEQVLVNLLNNASKYTKPGGQVSLAVEADGNEVAIRIRDNGIGISPELLPKVFDLFVQADRSLDRSQGGLGIGLSLVRNLVEMHGGRVQARSEGPGKGSEFIVRLPVLSEPWECPSPHDIVSSDGQAAPRRRILVVDDNVDAAHSLELLLKFSGHKVRTAHDGVAALELAKAFRPDAVLLDIGLPKLDGYEVARRIRQEPGLDQVLLLALSGYGHEEDRRRSHEAGFDDHLTKPVDLDKLQSLLAEAVPNA